MITIRYATREDAGLVADISRQTFYDFFAKQNTEENMDKFLNEQFTKETLMQEVGADHNIFLLAYSEKDLVGYARLRENNVPPELGNTVAMELARLYAVQSVVGKGVGSALMQECIAIAYKRQFPVIWLGVWKQNHRAIQFYERWGFEIFADHDFLLGNDLQKDWLMKKML